MTTINEKTPAPGATGNEGNEQISQTNSVTTAYLSYPKDNTGHTYGTWSDTDLKIEDHITLIIPIEDAQLIYADGSRLVRINKECVLAQSKEARKLREEKRAKQREAVKRQITAEVEEEFRDQLADLDDQYTELYKQIDAQAEARFHAERPEVDL
ncbi:hypothetical protein [Corynebacterium halotolerans]|uniref:hypothetical protein n=1 Tax=Corynebacterium halotolerans TaxID=225326 RepID=UPI003CE88654